MTDEEIQELEDRMWSEELRRQHIAWKKERKSYVPKEQLDERDLDTLLGNGTSELKENE